MGLSAYIKIVDRDSLRTAVERAEEVLKKGDLILYPTDTLYGLGIDVTIPDAVEKLYTLKGRSDKKPVSLMVGSIKQIEKITEIHPHALKKVFSKLFPGKITALIENRLKKSYAVFEYLQYPLEKIGFRIPQNRFCNLLNERMENPVSTTSANISGRPDIVKVGDLPAAIREKVDLIIDAGNAPDMRGSTIIDFTQTPYKIVRRGAVSESELNAMLNTDGKEKS